MAAHPLSELQEPVSGFARFYIDCLTCYKHAKSSNKRTTIGSYLLTRNYYEFARTLLLLTKHRPVVNPEPGQPPLFKSIPFDEWVESLPSVQRGLYAAAESGVITKAQADDYLNQFSFTPANTPKEQPVSR